MKRELFKEMHNKIQLDSEQKNRIWNNLEKEKERGYAGTRTGFHAPAFAVICVCAILMIGVPVLAADTSVVQSIINAFNTLTLARPNLTEEQKNIYAKYGDVLDNEIVLEHGTLKLEAIINDGHNICIPFSMYIKKGKFSDEILSEIADLEFYLGDNRYASQFTMLDDKQQKDRVRTGCYLLYSDERVMKQGEVLCMKSNKKRKKEEKPGRTLKEVESLVPVVSEVTVNAPAKKRNIPVKEIQKKLFKGASIDRIQLSPISLAIEGTEQKNNIDASVMDSIVEVELKDGSIVKRTSSGSHGSSSVLNEEYNSYKKVTLFEAPVALDDVAGIRIKNTSLNLWIPVTD